ncbi:MAG: gliding motility-associated C-terminal domain-containing protein [Brumimicrobium sp.]
MAKHIFFILILTGFNHIFSQTPPVAIFTIDNSTICLNDCINLTDHSLGNPTSWYWEFENATPAISTEQNPKNICFHQAGNQAISLTVINEFGDDIIFSNIQVLPAPNIVAIGDTTIDMGGTADIQVTDIDGTDFYWYPSDGVFCIDCLETTASPGVTTTYYASVVGDNGCVGRDTVTITVNLVDGVDVPDAFSPNGDGYNDRLRPLGNGIVEIDFKIYNRYGQLVYETDDISDSWDGTYNGESLNQGVFFWTLKYKLLDESNHSKSGSVTLIK